MLNDKCQMINFTLDSKLQADTFFIADIKISRVLLMNNANYPWLILVPREQGAVELTDLDFDKQKEILHEINLAVKILQQKFVPHKINIGALGNVVRQLHIHVIARFENDAAFPKPVWGEAAQLYKTQDSEALVVELKKLFTSDFVILTPLHKQLIYRSVHRGCKETDFLIGEFAKAKLAEINDLENFGKFLEEDDLMIYDWILAKVETPAIYKNLVEKIRQFHRI